MIENNKNYQSKLEEYDATQVGIMLMNMPHPQITFEARKRIADHIQQSLPIMISKQSRIIRFPAQSALQLAASLAIFILVLYQIAIPIATKTNAIDQLYPVQGIEELKDVDLISTVFS